jgi:hypothetical protein
MKTIQRILLPAALAVLFIPLLGQAASAQPRIGELRVQVVEVGSHQDFGSIAPGETITLPEGAKVRLIMTATPVNGGRTLYPETQFTDLNRGGLVITKTSVENANATVEVLSRKGRETTETVQYRITEAVGLPANVRTGRIYIHVVPAANWNQPSTGGGYSSGGAYSSGGYPATAPSTGQPIYARSRELVNALYRAILLRDMDEVGARSYITDIEKNGYDGLLHVADVIARSEESRVQVYSNNVTNQQRLDSLYRTLLGLSFNQVDSQQRNQDLSRLNSGDIAGVVNDIVHSDRFRSYQGV